MGTVDDVLEHFGVRGMHWGRRKASSAAGAASEDARKAANSMLVAKTHGTKALSNEELDHLVKRIKLEQQYSQLHPSGNAFIKRGKKEASDILWSIGKSQVTRVLNDQATKQVANLLQKNAAPVAKATIQTAKTAAAAAPKSSHPISLGYL